jgi:tRNA G26 N,N-dimethylase Trm1
VRLTLSSPTNAVADAFEKAGVRGIRCKVEMAFSERSLTEHRSYSVSRGKGGR